MAKSNTLTVCITAPPSLCDFIICVKDEDGRTMAEETFSGGGCDISLPDGKFKVCAAGNACAAPRVQERWVQFCGADPCTSECFSVSFIFDDICSSHRPPPPIYGPPCPPPYAPCPFCHNHDPHCLHCHPNYVPCPYCHNPHCRGECRRSVPCSPYYPYYPQFPVANWQFHYKEPVCGPDGRKICPPPQKCPPPPAPRHRPPQRHQSPPPKKQNRFCGLITFK